jgi:CRISPR system Cascade subunit CasA
MQKPYFNLIDEPWVPCIPLLGNGMPKLLSLRETLTKAHELREIYSDSPLTIAALHRLFLAILHDVFGPKDTEAWKELWRDRAWNEEKLNTYFESVYDHFYLFHETYPFYQVAKFPQGVTPKTKSISTLAVHHASGNNTTLFDHRQDNKPIPVSWGEAALLLVTSQSFMLGGGKSGIPDENYHHAPCASGAFIAIQGDTLYKSLVLNMRNCPESFSSTGRLFDTSKDKPVWKQNDPFEDKRHQPYGVLDYLTWQSRRIKLQEPETTLLGIQWIQITQGLWVENLLDPFQSYKISKKNVQPVKFDQEKALWRDSLALLELSETARTQGKESYTIPPQSAERLANFDVNQNDLLSQTQFQYLAIGMVPSDSGAGSASLWRSEHIPLPLKYLKNSESVQELRKALRSAEDVARALKHAADWLCWLWVKQKDPEWASPKRKNKELENDWRITIKIHKKDPDFKGYESFRKQFSIQRDFWWRLDEPFHRCLPGFASEDDALFMQAWEEWKNEIRDAAWAAWNLTADMLEVSPRTLHVGACAEEIFRVQLEDALKPKDSNEEGENDDDNSAH